MEQAILSLVAALDRNTEAVNAAAKLLAETAEKKGAEKESAPLHPL